MAIHNGVCSSKIIKIASTEEPNVSIFKQFFYLLFIVFTITACTPQTETKGPKENARFKYPTLESWSNEVLKWDESTVQAAINFEVLDDLLSQNKIDSIEFDSALASFAEYFVKSTVASKSSWLKQERAPIDFYNIKHFGNDTESKIDVGKIFYGQKIKIPENSSIIVMGDFHGSVHSLLRNLWRLYTSGYINNEFKIIKDNTYMVFTGDYVDRGRYSTETLYSLLRLKVANFDKVSLIRGNHEIQDISIRFGLLKELTKKYGDVLGKRLFKDFSDFYRFLPVVLFAEVKSKNPVFLHFSHGGFSYDAVKNELVHSPAPLLSDDDARYELMPEKFALGYMWSDFHQGDHNEPGIRGFSNADDGVSLLGKEAVLQYFHDIRTKTNKGLAGIFRGHQDQAFGVKMLFKNSPSDTDLAQLAVKNKVYPGGPFHWPDVVKIPEKVAAAQGKGITIEDYRPVFTFTTAAEGQAVPYDSYGIIKTKDALSDYSLEIHETKLVGRTLERSYMSIASAQNPNGQGISVTWSAQEPGHMSLLTAPLKSLP
jgi:hypothetical protein